MGQNWAIAIGINGYHNLQPLRFAKRDGEAMQAYFQQELGCKEIYHFSDDSPPIDQDYGASMPSQPTYGTLLRFLRVRFEKPFLNAGDNLWFFFAGHGIRHEDRDYLMPLDGDPGNVPATAIPLHDVTERLQRCGADNVILLIDACRSDSGQRAGLGVGQEPQPGVITLFSCSPKESSYEIEALQQGAFTHALLAGLRLQGEGNCATVERLYHYLVHTVPQLNAHHGKPRQTPYGRIEPPTKNNLILLPRQATLADVKDLKYAALNAELEQNKTLAKQLWIRVLVASLADPEAIAGIERLARVEATPPPPQPPTPQPKPSRGVGVIERPSTPPPTVPPTYRVDPVAPPPPAKPKAPTFEFEVVTISIEKTGIFGSGAPKVITQTRRRQATYHREALGNGVMLDLVQIPVGKFRMGSPSGEGGDDEKPQHEVRVPSFWMGKYPVTQAQWRAVAALPKVTRDLQAEVAYFKGGNRPVERVSWEDAMEFCQRLSKSTGRDYRLPSEAEWEYACRAGTTTPFYFGDIITPDFVNYDGKGTYNNSPKGIYREQTTEVGTFPPNGFGLYDMHGNIWEWCLDHWHESYKGAPEDGSAWLSSDENKSRLLRGGSWIFNPRYCRSAFRAYNPPDFANDLIGFRVACAAPRTL